MSFAKVNGLRLWYEIEGNGKPMIQLHGMGLGHTNFARVTPGLRKNFKVLDYDMRGFGDSEKPGAPYTIEEWADEAIALLDVLGLERVHVHGTSMGGMVATIVASKYPERVDRLVINCCMARYDNMARFNKGVWKSMARATSDTHLSAEVADLVVTQAFSREYMDTDAVEEDIAAMRASFMKNETGLWIHFCELLEEADLTPLLSRIQAPTYLLSGSQDIMTPIDAGPSGVGTRKMAEMIPRARLDIIDPCGHLTYMEAPEESVHRITKFLLSEESELPR